MNRAHASASPRIRISPHPHRPEDGVVRETGRLTLRELTHELWKETEPEGFRLAIYRVTREEWERAIG